MKKILVLTSIYPGGVTPKGFTPVVHYFVKEWVELGYDVRVIYAATYFPSIYYKAPKWFRRIVQNRIGIALPDLQHKEDMSYEYEGVKVRRLAMRKLVPLAGYSRKVLNKACDKAWQYLKHEDFYPEVIISHWINPQLALMSYLKGKSGAITAMVLHDSGEDMKKEYDDWRKLYEDVDIWGYRSISIKNKFENAFGIPQFSFRCFSGIPTSYCEGAPVKDGRLHNRFVQVGLLMERKYPHKTIDGLALAYDNKEFSLEIVGDGGMYGQLQTKIEQDGLKDRVHLCGRISREEVVKKLDEADVFILISRNEVFGLVYIEAMARGCIVVASRGEGMEGIIIDGRNGFFCNAGDSDELSKVIKRIQVLTNSERAEICKNAQATARQLTDKKVAKDYIDNVVGFGEKIKANGGEEVAYHSMNIVLNNPLGGG